MRDIKYILVQRVKVLNGNYQDLHQGGGQIERAFDLVGQVFRQYYQFYVFREKVSVFRKKVVVVQKALRSELQKNWERQQQMILMWKSVWREYLLEENRFLSSGQIKFPVSVLVREILREKRDQAIRELYRERKKIFWQQLRFYKKIL